MAESDAQPDWIDPFEAHARRATLDGAGVSMLVFDAGDRARAEGIASELEAMIAARGRPVECRILPSRSDRGLGRTLDAAVAEASEPIVLVTNAIEPWTAAHLDLLLLAVNVADHAIGRRPAGSWPHGVSRWLTRLTRRAMFATPVTDIHSPCRLHRREALAAIPLDSASSYVDVELLAKATFLAHLIHEVDVPPLNGDDDISLRLLLPHDRADLLRRPRFRRAIASSPAEEPQRQEEGDEPPRGEDQERPPNLDQAMSVQDHPA